MLDIATFYRNRFKDKRSGNGISKCLRLIGHFFLLLLLTNAAHGASKIYISNETGLPLHINSISVSGASLSGKAWKAGAEVIAPGERLVILTINRTGKFNWMDPTPRFIEPGKTAFFTSKIAIDKESVSPLKAVQKLTGTGSGSKMWHRVEGTTETFDWTLDSTQFKGVWSATTDQLFSVVYRSFKQGKDSHVEYVVSTDK